MTGELGPWTAHRRRAEVLRSRHGFAAQVLGLYVAVVDVWAYTWELLEREKPAPDQLAQWAVRRVMPRIAEATVGAGPPPLAAATRELLAAGGLEEAMAAWLAGGDLPAVQRYLARACLYAPLQALDAAAACSDDPAPRDDRHCPRCGGLPQLSVRSAAGDPLVSGPRRLVCARCAESWNYSRSACPFCGETQGSRRTLYAEQPATPRDDPVVGPGTPDDPARFPHLRIEACATCERYLIDIDLGRDGEAVPDVDELAALPLDLYAADRGLTKITPNIMGF
jgi:FdhE protein